MITESLSWPQVSKNTSTEQCLALSNAESPLVSRKAFSQFCGLLNDHWLRRYAADTLAISPRQVAGC
jgi:hypothetical protein